MPALLVTLQLQTQGRRRKGVARAFIPYIHRYRFTNGLAHTTIQMCFPQHTQAQMYVHLNVSGCFGHACMQKNEKSFSMCQCVGKVYKGVPLQI